MSEEYIFTAFDQDKLIECLTKQLSELELFQTMYSTKELCITDLTVVDGIQKFVAKETDYMPNQLDYTIKQNMENIKLDISVHLPSMYPEMAPDVYVRSNQLDGQQEKNLNTELTKHLQSKHDDEVCIFTAISWLQDNVQNFTIKTPTVAPKEPKPAETPQKFCRYWIYSHHIYAKKKIEDITKHAKDYQLNGFCLVGKPGVICIEGKEEDCKEWWKNIKALNWQKITLRITEEFNPNERATQQKFKSFEILHFSQSNNESFHKYMEKLGLLDHANQIIGLTTNS